MSFHALKVYNGIYFCIRNFHKSFLTEGVHFVWKSLKGLDGAF